MAKIGETTSLIVALFLLISMLNHMDGPTTAGMAIIALVVLAVYQFRPRAPRGEGRS